MAFRRRDREMRGGSRWGNDEDMEICGNSDDESPSSRFSVDPRLLQPVRDGILFEHDNYRQFLLKWIEGINERKRQMGAAYTTKAIDEKVTPATASELAQINMPEREKIGVLHVYTTITGLPPSVFFGSGYGNKLRIAKCAGAKDLVDKCLKIGIITKNLHEAIGIRPDLDMTRRLPEFVRAVDAVVAFDNEMAKGQWPFDVLIAREVAPATIAKLDAVIETARDSVYGMPAGTAAAAAVINMAVNDPASFCRNCRQLGHATLQCPSILAAAQAHMPRIQAARLEQHRMADAIPPPPDHASRDRSRDSRDRRGDRDRHADRDRHRHRHRSRSRDRSASLQQPKLDPAAAEIERKIAEQREKLRVQEEREKAQLIAMQQLQRLQEEKGPAQKVAGSALHSLLGMANRASQNGQQQLGPMHSPHQQQAPRHHMSIPSSYEAHVREMEERAMAEATARQEAMRERAMAEAAARQDAMRAQEEAMQQQRMAMREAAIRAEIEAKLQEELEAKKAALEEEIRARLLPREARRLRDADSALDTYGGMNSSHSTQGISAPGLVSHPPVTNRRSPIPGRGSNGHGYGNFLAQEAAASAANPYQRRPTSNAHIPTPGSSAYQQLANTGSGGASSASPLDHWRVESGGREQSLADAPSSAADDYEEMKRMVRDSEQTLLALAASPEYAHFLNSPILLKATQLGDNLHLLDRVSRHSLMDELRSFLDQAKLLAAGFREQPREQQVDHEGGSSHHHRRRSGSRERERERDRGERDRERERRRERTRSPIRSIKHGGSRKRSRSRSRERRRQEPSIAIKAKEASPPSADVIIQVGPNRFRQLTMKEAAKLDKDEVVVSQDLKNGRWTTAKVNKVLDGRVYLTVGAAIWKKEWNEVYKSL